MLVCHCNAVYEREVRDAIADGADDVFGVADRCEAGTVCGGCVPTVCRLLGQDSEPSAHEIAVLLGRDTAPTLTGMGAGPR